MEEQYLREDVKFFQKNVQTNKILKQKNWQIKPNIAYRPKVGKLS